MDNWSPAHDDQPIFAFGVGYRRICRCGAEQKVRTEDEGADDLLVERVEDVLETCPPYARRLQVIRATFTRLLGELGVALLRILKDLDKLDYCDLLDLPERLSLLGCDERARVGVGEQLDESVTPAGEEWHKPLRKRLELIVIASVCVKERIGVGLIAVDKIDDRIGRRRERDRRWSKGWGWGTGCSMRPRLGGTRLVEEFHN